MDLDLNNLAYLEKTWSGSSGQERALRWACCAACLGWPQGHLVARLLRGLGLQHARHGRTWARLVLGEQPRAHGNFEAWAPSLLPIRSPRRNQPYNTPVWKWSSFFSPLNIGKGDGFLHWNGTLLFLLQDYCRSTLILEWSLDDYEW